MILLTTVSILVFNATLAMADGGAGGTGGAGGDDSVTGAGENGERGGAHGGGGGGAGETGGRGGNGGYSSSVGGAGGASAGADGEDGEDSGSSGGGGGGGGAHGFVGTTTTGGTTGGNGGDGGSSNQNEGGGGGAGGYGAVVTGESGVSLITSAISGGDGGDGGDAGNSTNAAGDGGSGGVGLYSSGTSATLTVSSGITVSGGDGGDGGAGNSASSNISNGGDGGDGGDGLDVTGDGTTVTVVSGATVSGGDGGDGGDGGTEKSYAGKGGRGGDGLNVSGSAAVVTIEAGASVTGGDGGDGGAPGYQAGRGRSGGAGVVVSGGGEIEVAGTVTGGNGGASSSANRTGSGGAGIEAEDVTLTLTGTSTVTGGLDGDGTAQADAIDFTGGTNVLTIASGATISGEIGVEGTLEFAQSDAYALASVLSGDGSISKTGTGTLTLTGASTFTGSTTVSEGTLLVTGSIASSEIAIDGGTLDIDGNALDDAADVDVSSGDLTLSGSETIGSLSGTGGTVTLGAYTLTLAGDGDTVGYDGVISGSGDLTKTGTDVLTLTGANTFTGTTTISAGTLTITGSITSSEIAIDGGTLDVDGAALEDTADVNISSGGLTLSGSETIGSLSGTGGTVTLGAYTLTLDGAGETVSYGGTISGAGGLIKTGTDVLTLTGTNTFTGSTTVSAGTLTITGSIASSEIAIDGGTLDVDGDALDDAADVDVSSGDLTLSGYETIGSLSGTGGTVALGTYVLTLAGDGDTVSYDGTISGGVGGISKTGTDSLTLSGTSTSFSGTTTVSAGSLLVTGTLGSSSSVVYVASGATLGGTGTIGGSVTVSGILSPGASPGTLTIAGDLTLNPGSTSLFELNTPEVATGSTNDFISVGGDLTLGGTLDASVGSAGYYYLYDYAGSLSGSYSTVTVSGVADATGTVVTGISGEVNLLVTGTDQTLQFWDGSTSSPDGSVEGGSGTWDATTTNWTNEDGTANAQWISSVAVFTGTAGTVTVSGTQSFDTLQFKTNGYQLADGTLALAPASGSAGTINVDADVTATIASTIADGTATTLSKQGSGRLILTGANTYTGGTEIAAGTMEVAADAALGDASGALTLDGGTLATTESFTTARLVTLSATTGGFDVAADTTLGLTGTISGSGALIKAGEGTLALSGINTYTGGTTVEAGTLIGSTASIQGDLENAGTVEFAQASDGTFDGTIDGLDGTDGDMVKSGDGTLTLAGASSLDWSVLDGAVVATDGFSGSADIAEDTSLTFDQDFESTYDGALSGAGDVVFTGGGTITLASDSESFSGTTTISDFTLSLSGTLGGTVTIASGGTLAGNGTVGSTTVSSGGAISPGNSIGTVTVDGKLTFLSDSTYEVEVNPDTGDSDLVDVSGVITIDGGDVVQIGMIGSYAGNTSYTILSSDTGIDGTFDSVATSLAFLDPLLLYDANSVTLQLVRNDIDFVAYAETPNQQATAYGAESLGAGNPVYNAVAGLDQAAVPGAFDALSGEIHASLKTGLISDSRFVRDAALARTRGMFGTKCVTAGVQDCASGQPDQSYGAWSQAFGSFGEIDGNSNTAELDTDTGGVIFGGDTSIGDAGRAGVLAGYQSSRYTADARASRADADSFFMGIYGGAAFDGFNLSGGAAYAWSDIETTRTVAFSDYYDALTGSTDAGTAQVFGELGYQFDVGNSVIEPFAGLAYVAVSTDAYTESGGSSALSIASDTTDVTYSTLGIRASTTLDFGEAGAARLTGMAGWRHAYGALSPTSLNAFAGGAPFTVAGVPVGEDVALISAGLEFDLGTRPEMGIAGASFGIFYDGQFGSGVVDSALQAKLSVSF